MIAPTRILTTFERRLADRDAAILDLVGSLVNGAELSPRRETELRQAATERMRVLLDRLEGAVVMAAALEREERAADQHVQHCSWCRHWRVIRTGVCRGFRQLIRGIERRHHQYRRAFRRLEAS